ncbi:MAG: hypothetical protein SOZ34_10255 [Clostridia bacterium]|nr:hypothetical protein [Clostridia bacterium]
MKRILALLLSMAILVPFYAGTVTVTAAGFTQEEKEAAEQLFQYLNPKDERVADVYSAYKAKNYKKALELYRNYFINKLVKKNVGQTGWHNSNIAGTFLAMADILVGKMTVEQFAQKYDDRKHYNYLEWWGDPDNNQPVNWLGGMGVEPNAQSDGLGFEVNFRHLNKLGAAFWNSDGDEIYLKKYLQIIDDYCVNQKKVTDQYLIDNPTVEPDVRFWMTGGKYAQNYLWLFERMNNSSRELAYFAKMLVHINNGDKPEWADIGLPVEGELKQEDYDLFNPLVIAHYAYSIITDHLELCQNVLKDGFLITNQHSEGVLSFAKMRELFDEFSNLNQYDERLAHAMNVLTEGVAFADGSLSERSFNYNSGTVKGYEEVVEWLETAKNGVPEYAQNYGDAVKNWDRLVYAYRTTIGDMPWVGNGGGAGTTRPIWNNENAYQEKKASVNIDEKAEYTSVYLPIGGYGTMLSGRDMLEDVSLNFYNNNKKSGGHTSNYTNAVTLTGYGRPLIATGGGPWYGEGFAPESQKPIYDILNKYFEEGSTYKGSTLIVNGGNQTGHTIPAGELLKSNWMAGKNFDYGEGTWNGAYTTPAGKTGNYAIHNRNFIFVKQAKLFIVEDEVQNLTGNSNTYSQIWRMPTYVQDQATMSGFKNEQVVLDENDKVMYTNDTNGPNIWISAFGSNDLSYVKYYGQLDPIAIGWSYGESSERVPAADVHISWNDEAKETTKVASVLDPVKNTDKPFKSKTDISDKEKGITGFEYVTDDDIKITYYSSVEPQELTYKNITANAKILLTVEREGEPVNAMVFGADKVNVGEKELSCDKNGFEFTVTESDTEILNTIYVPTYFKWVEEEDGSYYPKYDSISDSDADKIIESIKNKTSSFRILRYSDSKYLIGFYNKIAAEAVNSLSSFNQMPSSKKLDEVKNAIIESADKIADTAEYYKKTEYSDKVISELKVLFDECAIYAEKNRSLPELYNAYRDIMENIVCKSKVLNAENENIPIFENALSQLDNANEAVDTTKDNME